MISNKKIFFSSIGLMIKEIKKSFLISSIFFIILFGLAYIFFLIASSFYSIIDNANKANLFFTLITVFAIVLIGIGFIIINKIRKITLLKCLNPELNSKNRKFLEFIDNYLDLEFKNPEIFKKFLRFILIILISLLIIYFLIGLIIVNNIYLSIITILLTLSLFGPFILFITRQVFYVKSIKELVLNYKLFKKYYSLFFWVFITSIIPLAIIISLFYLPSFPGKIYLLLLLLAIAITKVFYFNFFIFSQLFIQEHKKE